MKKLITVLIILSLTIIHTTVKSFGQELKDSTFKQSFNQVIRNGDKNRLNLHDPLDILKAQAVGVTFLKKGSDPNQFNSVNIRGKETGYSPQILYIIDGIMGADPSMLLPDDIESIEIIRDGAQLTAYGTQGCSGVIVIKTKHYTGNKKISVNFSSFITINSLAKKIDLLSAEQVRSTVAKYDMNFVDGGSSTDWQEEIMRKPVSQIYNLGISGKLNNTVYDFSAFFDKNPGIVKGTSRKNNGANLKLSHSALNNKLVLYSNFAYNTVNAEILPNLITNYGNDIFFQALRRNPTDPVYESDGVTYHQVQRDFRYLNPLQIIDAITSNSNTNNLRINAGGTYNIVNGLDAGINFGYSNSDYKYDFLQPIEALNEQDELSSNTSNLNKRMNVEAKINYNTILNDAHNISAGAIFRYRTLKFETESYSADGSYKDTSIYNEDRNYSNIIMTAGYNFRQRYYVNVIANIESSELVVSGFQTSIDQVNRSKFYPSVMAGWEISNEKFLNDNTFISHLLLKASYGIRGNGNADINMFYRYSGIENLKTEKFTELNIALDFGLLKDKVTGSFGWYSRNTDNGVGIYYLPVPPYLSYYTYKNAYKISSNGLEAMISVKAIDHENFKWNSQLNFFKYEDELKEGSFWRTEGTPTGYFNLSIQNYPTQLLRAGSPSNVFYLPVSAGYSEDGRPLYYTETGTKTRDLVRAKYEIMSQTDPKFYMGWVNSFNVMKNFDLSVSMSYTGGYSIYNATRMYLSNPFFLPSMNISEEGLNNLESGYETSAFLSDTYLENASYLRVDDLTLSYTFTCKKMKTPGQLKIYASAGNLFTVTDYTGYDPAGESDGVDYFDVYPLARTYTLGIRFNF